MAKLLDKRMILLMSTNFVAVGFGLLAFKFSGDLNGKKTVNEQYYFKETGAKLKTIGLNSESIKMLKIISSVNADLLGVSW